MAAGRQDEFHRWVDGRLAAARGFPGHLASGLLEPVPGGAVRHVVHRFDTPGHQAQWEASHVRRALIAGADEFVQSVAVRRLDGMDAWFATQGRAPAPRRAGRPSS